LVAIVERQSIVTSSSFSGAREKQMASTLDISDSDEFAARPREAESSLISTEDEIGTAVCWGAIIAGALAATAVTMILLVLGVGAGLSIVSPWYRAGASAVTVGVSALAWLIVVQWISSCVGGYLAGRMRIKWVGVHSKEVFFRDTAHGFLAWSLASVAGALIIAAATLSGASGIAQGAADVTAAGVSRLGQNVGVDSGANAVGGSSYFVDTLFRSAKPGDEGNDSHAEAMRILSRSLQNGNVALAPADAQYLAQMVAARAGLSPADAQQRVDSVVNQLNDSQQKLRQMADAARKQAARVSMATALAMLIGAFIASAAAALGGSIRDE
jgi:hypothetical protein